MNKITTDWATPEQEKTDRSPSEKCVKEQQEEIRRLSEIYRERKALAQ